MTRILVTATIAALALATTVEAKPHKEKKAARQMAAVQRANGVRTTAVAPVRTRTVARNYYTGSRHYGGGRYYGSGYYPYRSSGTSISIGIGAGYPGYYGYGYGYPYSYGYGYPYGYSGYYGYSSGYARRGNVVAEVQSRLAHRGYYHGVIDGVVGPRTRSAIAHYEANHGMIVDGRIDRNLLRSLDLS